MGWLIGQFAVGVIGVSQEMVPAILVPGMTPYAGSTLIVQWKSFLLILFGLASVQLLVTVFAAAVGNSVVVKDDSRLAIARLLRRAYTTSRPFPSSPCDLPALRLESVGRSWC